MKGNKLVIAVILALIVCLVLIPTCAFAEGEGEGGDSVTPVVEQEGQQPEQSTTPPVPPTEEEANPSDNDEGKNLPKSGDKEVTEQSASGENEPKDDSSESSGDVKDEAKPEGGKTPGEENVPLQPSESKYTVEFTAGEKQYVLGGDTSIGLDDILGELGISGTVTEASSSNDSLFSVVADENGKWTVSANNAFSTTHSLTVVVDGQTYEIVVTDDNVCVVKNGSTEAEYGTLQEAIDKAKDGDTIVLKDNVTESVTIAAGKTITIDLNGKTLTNGAVAASGCQYNDTISNWGNLTVIDNSANKSGVVDNTVNGCGALVNYEGGVANLLGGTFTRSDEHNDSTGRNSWYTIKNMGVMTIDGATITTGANSAGSSSLIATGRNSPYASNDTNDRKTTYAGGKISLTVKSGKLMGGMNTIKNEGLCNLVIEGGEFSNTTGPVILNWSDATISGGTFTAVTNNSIIVNGTYTPDGAYGNLTITGGTFNTHPDNCVIRSNNPYSDGPNSVSVSGGNFNGTMGGDLNGATTDGNTKLTISGGVYTDNDAKKFADKDNVVVISANGKTAVANNKDAASIKEIIAEAVKSGEPLVIENLPEEASVSAPEGVTIINKSDSTLTVNGVAVKPGESYTVPTTAAPAFAPLSAKYFVLEGKAQQWTDGDLEFVLNSNAVVKVLIDGVEVEFMVAEDGTVTIASAVIEALDAGTHEIEFVFADGSCTTTFTK